jgi:hypothetical protein
MQSRTREWSFGRVKVARLTNHLLVGYLAAVVPDELFLHTMRDLRRRVESPDDEYDLLMAAGLLRKLLLDDQPLVHQVNRRFRLKFAFEIATNDVYEAVILEDKPVVYVVNDAISPRAALPRSTMRKVNLDGFLARRAAYVHGHDVSVKELILQVANVEGAVHAGTARDEKHRVLAGASETIKIGGAGLAAATMRGIGWVVLDALAPIEAALLRER